MGLFLNPSETEDPFKDPPLTESDTENEEGAFIEDDGDDEDIDIEI